MTMAKVQNLNLKGTVDASVQGSNSTKKQDKATSFDSVMNLTSNQQNNNDNKNVVTQSVKQSKPEDKRLDIRTKSDPKNVKDVKDTDSVDEVVQDPTNVIQEKVENVIENLKEEIQDVLGIDEEQLNELMESLGLTDVDLLNPDQLVQLVTQFHQFDQRTDLLSNETAVTQVKEILNSLQENLENNQLTPKQVEEFVSQPIVEEKQVVVTNVPEQTPQTTEKQPEGPIVEVVNEKQPETSFAQNNNKENLNARTEAKEFSGKEFIAKEEPVSENLNAVNFVKNFSQAVAQTNQLNSMNQAQAVDIVNQVVEAIKVNIKADTSTIQMQLNPEHLGKVNIQVINREGTMSAQITAQTEAAKHAIETNIQTLKEAFQNQGLKVEEVEVTVSPRSFENQEQTAQQEQQSSSKKSKHFRGIDELETDEMEEDVEQIMMKQNGNQVDYTA